MVRLPYMVRAVRVAIYGEGGVLTSLLRAPDCERRLEAQPNLRDRVGQLELDELLPQLSLVGHHLVAEPLDRELEAFAVELDIVLDVVLDAVAHAVDVLRLDVSQYRLLLLFEHLLHGDLLWIWLELLLGLGRQQDVEVRRSILL